MRILVIGSNSFIGKHLVEEYTGKYELICISRSMGMDLMNPKTYNQIGKSIDCIIHLAANTVIHKSDDSSASFYKENIKLIVQAAKFAKENQVKLFIYPNTYTYGNPQYLPIDEEHPISPLSLYHESKIESEEYLLDYFKGSLTNVFVGRLFNVYGYHQANHFLIPRIIEQIKASRKVVLNDLKPKRDFIYIKDLLNLFDQVIHSSMDDSVVCNVASGNANSVLDLLNIIKKQLNFQIEVECLDQPRENEIYECTGNIDKVKSVFDWCPEYSLEEGIHDILARKGMI